MARFRYRMQNILELDERLEEQQRAAFALANLKLSEEQEKLQQLMMKKAMYEQSVKQHAIGIVDIKGIHRAKNAVKACEYEIKEQMGVIRQQSRVVDAERIKLNQAMQERKTQEKLREKAFEEFMKEEALEENKVTDELISFKYGTNAKAEDEE